MNPDEQLRTVFEQAGFITPVSKVMNYRTGADVNDGFGNLIATYREHTLSQTHQDSVVKLWIQRFSEIGPVLDVKIICHRGRHGIEIQIPSTSGDNTHAWVIISRSPNRYVDDLRYRDREHFLEEADYECMQDPDQEQATNQLEM